MSTRIQQKFPWIRGILGSASVSATTDTGDQQLPFGPPELIKEGLFVISINSFVLEFRKLFNS
jgi:hypothetical protein